MKRESVVGVSFFFFSSRRRHTRSLCDWSSDVCSSDLSDAMKLRDIVPAPATFDARTGSLDITGIAVDSRAVKPGNLFVAVPGTKVDRSEERRVGKESRSRWAREQ